MRGTLTYLVHPARLTALGLLGALALTVLMLAGRPEAPPEAEATLANTSGLVSISDSTPGATNVTLVFQFDVMVAIPVDSGFAFLTVQGPGAPLGQPIPFTNWPADGVATISGPTGGFTHTLPVNMNGADFRITSGQVPGRLVLRCVRGP